jgi:hypothetical protein
MTDALPSRADTTQKVRAGLRRRYAAERRFKAYGLAAIGLALLMLAVLFGTIIANGWSAFRQTYVLMEVLVDEAEIDPAGNRDPAVLSGGNYEKLIKQSLSALFPEVKKRKEKRELYDLVSSGAAYDLRDEVMADPSLVGQTLSFWVHGSDDVDMYMKGYISADLPEDARRVSDKQIARIELLRKQGRISTGFNFQFFTGGDSREPELAGIAGAALGSLWTMLVVLIMAFPMGVMSAIYLEEFAPKNRWTDIIEVRHASFGAAGRWPCAGADDPADDHHRRPRRAEGGAAVDSRGRAGAGRQPHADGGRQRLAAGNARHADRCHYRHGAGAGRNCAAADDRYGRLYRRSAEKPPGRSHGAAGADLSMGR